jgi:RNA polymerase sigma factor (sigma-70 family)
MTRDQFDYIIHENYRKLYYIAFRILNNRQEAEDVVQEVFLKMWSMGDKLDDYRDTGALAHTMTKNCCLDMLRKWKHTADVDPGKDTPVSGSSPSPYDQLVISEMGGILSKIIGTLPTVYQKIVKMRDIDGMSFEEISAVTEININNLRVNLSRARSIIREKYLQYSYERREIKRAD